jgi:hypothetical protein
MNRPESVIRQSRRRIRIYSGIKINWAERLAVEIIGSMREVEKANCNNHEIDNWRVLSNLLSKILTKGKLFGGRVFYRWSQWPRSLRHEMSSPA